MKLDAKKWNHVITINNNVDSKLILKAQSGDKQRKYGGKCKQINVLLSWHIFVL